MGDLKPEEIKECLDSIPEREMTQNDVENLVVYLFDAVLKACGDKVIPAKNLANRTTPVALCRMLAQQVADILNKPINQ